jgi:SOS-response transcriptional repressor LexA
MDNQEKIYNYLKSFMKENGYPQTSKQMASDLNIPEHEIKEAIEKLQESGRIKITDIPRKTTIEFCD